MFVDVDEMRAGAALSFSAAGLADEGARNLAATSVGGGIFGAFTAAESFHRAVSSSRERHLQKLRREEERLGSLGDNAHLTASTFTDMEARNAEALRAVVCPTTRN